MSGDPSSEEQKKRSRESVYVSVNAFSRVMAVIMLMLVPGALGYFLDGFLKTSVFVVIGFLVGMVIAGIGLMFVVRQANEDLKQKFKR
jgi:F0F1-type ATP synthase assembly protein I